MSNDIYYQSRTADVYGGTISLILVAVIAVVLRLTARRLSAARLWWDDWTLLIALILDFCLCIGYWVQVRLGGLGRHTVAVGGPIDDHGVSNFFKTLLAIQILYFSSAVAIKTSLLLLYYRIFGVVRWFRWVLAVAWTIVLLYYVIALFIAIFECTPVAFYWNKTIAGGTCIDQNRFYRWNGVANLLIDFMILSLTMPMVWRLNLEIRQKISLSCIFLLGMFASVASIIRVTAFSEVNFADITYTIVTASIFTTIEQSMGIICACLPTLRPLVSRLRDDFSKYANSNSNHPSSSEKSHHAGIAAKDSIALKNVKPSKPKKRPALDGSNVGESGTGFAKLAGDIESGLFTGGLGMTGEGEGGGVGGGGGGTVTTRVGTSPSGFREERTTAAAVVEAAPESILRQQTVEQVRHHVRRPLNEF